jgi:hypothetical protein
MIKAEQGDVSPVKRVAQTTRDLPGQIGLTGSDVEVI